MDCMRMNRRRTTCESVCNVYVYIGLGIRVYPCIERTEDSTAPLKSGYMCARMFNGGANVNGFINKLFSQHYISAACTVGPNGFTLSTYSFAIEESSHRIANSHDDKKKRRRKKTGTFSLTHFLSNVQTNCRRSSFNGCGALRVRHEVEDGAEGCVQCICFWANLNTTHWCSNAESLLRQLQKYWLWACVEQQFPHHNHINTYVPAQPFCNTVTNWTFVCLLKWNLI